MALATFPAVAQLRRVPSLIYVDPSNLTNEAGYGTLLGLTASGASLVYNYATDYTVSEEFGTRPTAEWYLGEFVQVQGTLQSVGNTTAITKLFPNQDSSGDITFPGTALPGDRLDTASLDTRVLIMPYDECTVNPCFLGQYCTMHVAAGALSLMRTRSNFEIPFVINCFPFPGATEAYRTAFIGNKANATLVS